ncbi:hypothetical protein D3C75_1321850 [compost metagenome]
MGRVQIDMVGQNPQGDINMQILIRKFLDLLHVEGTDVFDLAGGSLFQLAKHAE